MLRSFIFNEENKWIEESQILLFHDICVVIDTKEKTAYLWNGPNTKKARIKKAKKELISLFSNFTEKKWEISEKISQFPSEITQIIDSMLELSKKNREMGKLKFSRFSSIRVSFILLIIIFFLNLSSIIFLITLFFIPSVYGVYMISSDFYFLILEVYGIITIITLLVFIINFLLGFFEKDYRLAIFSLVGIIVDLGVLFYINQGIFLFIHQEGSTGDLFLILKSDFIIFLLLNIIALAIEFIPNLYQLTEFYKTYKDFIFISE